MDGSVSFHLENGIGTIEFFHPKGNSLPAVLLAQLSDTIQKAGENPEVKVIVLRSGGSGAFCAGASFDELLALENEEEAIEFFQGFGNVLLAMKDCPKFIIARVQGKAVGGGVGLIAGADYAIASKTASIKLSELSIGFGPFVISPVLIRKVGLSAFSTLAIDSKNWRNADWGRGKGLFNYLISDESELDESVQKLADSLSNYSAEAMKEIKSTLWEGYSGLQEIFQNKALLSGKLSQSEITQKILTSLKNR